MSDIKDGDIFRWSYRNGGSTWCKSCICIANNGILRDTYWSHSGDGAAWTYKEAAEKLNLRFVANLAELERRRESDADYYDDADIVNLNHSNSTSGNFYIRKGAMRSKAKMQKILIDRIAEEERKIERAKDQVGRFRHTISQIEAGEPLERIYL
jgi:hypothetical protein